MDKIVSFIIPSYNVEKYLDKCLTSFLNLEVLDFIEVIVVDDGSKDQGWTDRGCTGCSASCMAG